jgi:hypothetical protein
MQNLTAFFWMGVTLASGVAHAAASPLPSLVDTTARIEYGHVEGTARLLVKVDGLDTTAMAQTDLLGNVADSSLPKPTSVSIDKDRPEIQQHGATSRMWLLTLAVKDLPTNTTQTRYLTVTLGGKDVTLAYTLTNTAADKFTWTVRGPPAITVVPGGSVPISLSMGNVPATGVTVLRTDLVDKSTHAPISETGLSLCRSSTRSCTDESITLGPSEPGKLWLWGANTPGRFEGTVTIATPEKPEGDPMTITVYVTSIWYELAGVGAILIGVILSWFFTVVIKNRINRDQLLLPVAALLETLGLIKAELTTNPTPTPVVNVTTKLANIKLALSTTNLQLAGLPPPVPAPWSAPPTTASVDGYRTYIQTQSDWTSALQLIVESGLAPTWTKWKSTPPAQQSIIEAGLSQIDLLMEVSTPPAINALQAQIQALLTKLNADLAVARIVVLAASIPATTVRSTDQIQIEVARLGVAAWAFIAVATSLAGAYILIFSPAAVGFGNPQDFLLCLLWGFGFSAGPQLMQSTTNSISATFGVAR